MDPLTAIGAVASIAQLAQGALSLSKTLYTLGAAVASANDDMQVLADDLKTFSQSLTLLSRLLEDSKSWYSDDIYLLTAKIIKDCAELYIKIDKILVKLGGNGKSTWKLRVKFVYKEGQIRKLMKRLRDMKGTLATILMSLQVDLQLSLLNISSSSKIQREPEKPLQPETVQTLVDAQKAAQQTGFLSKYAVYSEHVVYNSEKGYDVLKSRHEEVSHTPPAGDSGTCMEWTQSLNLEHKPSLPTKFPIQPILTAPRGIEKGPANVTPTPAMSLFQPINMIAHQEIPRNTAKTDISSCGRIKTTSLRSASSVESFQSAVSVQRSLHELEARNEVEQQVEAVRSVLHAFRTALEVLGKLVEKRCLVKRQELFHTAKDLERSLIEGEKEFNGTHDRHCRRHGPQYIQAFTDSHNIVLQDVSSALMKDVVMPLHMYAADHVNIRRADLETLRTCSERCKVEAIFIIINVASLLCNSHPDINIDPHSSLFHPEVATELPIQYTISRPPRQSTTMSEVGLPFIGYTFKRFVNHREISNPTAEGTVQPDKKDLDALSGDQPISMQTEYWPRREPPSRLSERIDPIVSSVPPSSSQEPDRLIDSSLASSVSPVSPLCSLTYPLITPNLNGGTGGEWHLTRATSIQLQASLELPTNNLQLQQSQGQQIISQRHLRAASQSQYPDMPLELPNSTGQMAQAQLQRIQTIRQQQNLNSIPPDVQSRPVPMGTTADFGPFMSIENIIDQQQQGAIAQAAGQIGVPASGTKGNAMSQPQFALPSPITMAQQQQELMQLQRQQHNIPHSAPPPPPAVGNGPSNLFGGITVGQAPGIPGHSPQQETTSSPHFGLHLPSPLPMGVIGTDEAYTPRLSSTGVRGVTGWQNVETAAVDPLRGGVGAGGDESTDFHPLATRVSDSEVLQDFDFDSFLPPESDYPARRRIQNSIAQRNYRNGKLAISSLLGDLPSTSLPTTLPSQSLILCGSIEDDSAEKATGSTSEPLDAASFTDSDSGERRASTLVKKTKLKQLKQEREQRAATDFNLAEPNGFVAESRMESDDERKHCISLGMSRDSDGRILTETENSDRSDSELDEDEEDGSRSVSASVLSKPCSRPLTPLHKIGGILTELSDREKRKLAMVEDSFRKMEQGQPSRKRKRTSESPTIGGAISSTISQPASKSRQISVNPQRHPEGEVETAVEIVSLSRLCSDGPFRELWWQAYCFLNSFQPIIFESLSSEFKKQYGEFLSNVSEDNLSTRVTDLVEDIGAKRYRGRPYPMPLADHQANIVKVVMTISSQLGLEKPVMGWAFVGVFLSIYERLLETWDPSLPDTDIEAITKSFQQLQDLAGLLARYAVMQNLYHQNESLTLTPEYRNGLQDLCITILQYFGNALVVARGTRKEESTSVIESRKSCDILIDKIREKDKACQGFHVVVDADEQSDTMSEDAEIEDVSDEGWEVFSAEESSASEPVT